MARATVHPAGFAMRALLLAALLLVAASAALAAPASANFRVTACAGGCIAFYPPDPCNSFNPGNLCYLPPDPCYGAFVAGFGAQVCHTPPQ
jgi:hypothetical protein